MDSGTFGFLPGEPSASTQPLYAWFLIAVYWVAGRHWWSLGTAQMLIAVATALVVYEIGRRFLSPRIGLVGAVIATLQPYLVWHDVHGNREILDQLLGAAAFGLTLLVAVEERRRPGAVGPVGGDRRGAGPRDDAGGGGVVGAEFDLGVEARQRRIERDHPRPLRTVEADDRRLLEGEDVVHPRGHHRDDLLHRCVAGDQRRDRTQRPPDGRGTPLGGDVGEQGEEALDLAVGDVGDVADMGVPACRPAIDDGPVEQLLLAGQRALHVREIDLVELGTEQVADVHPGISSAVLPNHST